MAPSHLHAACFQEPIEQLVIWPHRSLGRGGIRILVSSVGAAFAALSTWAVLIGAWPMLVYITLALAGFLFALKCNICAARVAQMIEFAPDKIRIRKWDRHLPDRRRRNSIRIGCASSTWSIRTTEPGYCCAKAGARS